MCQLSGDISCKKLRKYHKKMINFPNNCLFEINFSPLCASCSPLPSDTLLWLRFFLFLHLLTKQCCTSQLPSCTSAEYVARRAEDAQITTSTIEDSGRFTLNKPRVLDCFDQVVSTGVIQNARPSKFYDCDLDTTITG